MENAGNTAEAEELMADLQEQLEKAARQRDRAIKAAIALKNAKLKAALQRKAASEANEMMKILVTIPEESELDPDLEKGEILNQISQGESAESAVHAVLRRRHLKERKDAVF